MMMMFMTICAGDDDDDLPGGGPDGDGFGMLVGLPLFFPKREEDSLI